MGFYDDEQNNTTRSKKKNYFLTGLIGAIIGALIVVFSIPVLSKVGLLPSSEQVSTQTAIPGVKKAVNVSVTTDTTKAVEKVSSAVVGVINIQKSSFWDDPRQDNVEAGSGSGVIYKKENGKAYIVTNNHVVEGASQLEVSLKDGTRLPAKLLGRDQWTDLAVLEVDGAKVTTVASFGNSDELKAGEPAIAIGNPLGKFTNSVTQGIISATGRAVPVDVNGDGVPDWQADVLQTDAAINPGNSGGALVNIAGQVVGINSMKIAESAVEGIGFAIPINSAEPVISDLEQYGQVKRPYIGVGIRSLSDVSSYHWHQTLKLPNDITGGVIVMNVEPLSPAGRAGLKEYDVIVGLDDQPVNNVIDFRKYLYQKKQIGETVKITYYRDGKKGTVELKLQAAK